MRWDPWAKLPEAVNTFRCSANVGLFQSVDCPVLARPSLGCLHFQDVPLTWTVRCHPLEVVIVICEVLPDTLVSIARKCPENISESHVMVFMWVERSHQAKHLWRVEYMQVLLCSPQLKTSGTSRRSTWRPHRCWSWWTQRGCSYWRSCWAVKRFSHATCWIGFVCPKTRDTQDLNVW